MMSPDEEKQYKVMTELMTHLFQQCGYLPEENIIELDNYNDFLKTLQHHVFMGNVSITQLTHYMMLMVYKSFCRLIIILSFCQAEKQSYWKQLSTSVWW